MKRAIVLFIMFMVLAFGSYAPAYAEEPAPDTGTDAANVEDATDTDGGGAAEENPPDSGEPDAPEPGVPSDTDGMQGDLKNEIQGMLDQFKAEMDEKYADKPWYERASNFWDQYIGYLVSGIVLLVNIGAVLFGMKYGKKNIYKYYAWCKDSFVPWMSDALEQFKHYAENANQRSEFADKRYTEMLEKYKELERMVEDQDKLKTETQRVITEIGEEEKTDRNRMLKQTRALRRILSVVASQMAYLSQSTGLNNETAEQIRAKYDALLATLESESEDAEHE